MMNFKTVVEEYLDTPTTRKMQTKSETAHRRLNEMCKAWGEIPLDEISDKHVRDFFRGVKKKRLAGGTYNTYVTYYRALMNFGMDELNLIRYVPKVKSMPEHRRNEFLEPEEAKRLLEELDPIRRDLASMCLLTGLRKTNATNLKIDQVSKCGSFIKLPGVLMKNGSPLEVTLNDAAKAIVKRRLDMVKTQEQRYPYLKGKIEHLVVQDSGNRKLNGRPITQMCNLTWRSAVERAGLPTGTCVHHMRHTFASWHKRQGTDPDVIRQLGGWESMRSMEQYSHVTAPEVKIAAGNIDNII
jgi:integrase